MSQDIILYEEEEILGYGLSTLTVQKLLAHWHQNEPDNSKKGHKTT
jgi:hypothetical protein